LILKFDISPEVTGAKRSIVGMVALDTDNIVTCKLIKVMLGLESFSDIEGDLMAMMDVCCCMIHK
jgi:hypothetical protein